MVGFDSVQWSSKLSGYYQDERSAALIYDQVGVDLGLPNFPMNLPNESLDDPLLSQAHLKI
jgi:hypothetical protein